MGARDAEYELAAQQRSTRSSSPTGSASTTRGRSSTTSSRSTRHSSAPEVFLGGRQPAHEEHPPRPRHHPAHDEPPGARRRAGLARSTCVSTGASSWASARRAASPSCIRSTAASATSARCGKTRVQCLLPMFCRARAGSTTASTSTSRCATSMPEAAAEAASAAVGGVQPARHDRDGRPAGHGRARLPVRVGRGGARLGATPTTTRSPSELDKLCDYATNPNIAVVSASSCARRPTRRRSAAPRARRSSSSRWSSTTRTARSMPGTVNLWDEYLAWKETPKGQAATAARRAHRLARHDPQTAAQVRGVERRPGDPAQPGGQEHARGHLRGARAVRRPR